MYTGWYCHRIALRPTQQSRMLERLSLCHSMCDRRDLNVSRRLRRMLKASALLRVGKAHVLRMRYVQLTRTLCILQCHCTRGRCHCTRGRIVSAMGEILEGWADTQEGASRLPRAGKALSGTQRSNLPKCGSWCRHRNTGCQVIRPRCAG